MENGVIEVSFVAGNSMVIPRGAIVKGMLSIPRAELSAADALASAVMQVENELDIPGLDETLYFSDSEVVLNWINNEVDMWCLPTLK